MVKKVWQTDGQTDRQTDWTSHIAAWSQLKIQVSLIIVIVSISYYFQLHCSLIYLKKTHIHMSTSQENVKCSLFVLFCCGLVPVESAHIIRCCITGSDANIALPPCHHPTPVKQYIDHVNYRGLIISPQKNKAQQKRLHISFSWNILYQLTSESRFCFFNNVLLTILQSFL